MHIEFVEDEQDQVCDCCAEMFDEVEDFVNEYVDSVELETFTLQLLLDNLISLYQTAKEQGRKEALEDIGNFALDLANPEDDEDGCDCDCGECC